MVCVRSLSALQSEVTGIFPMARGCNFNSLNPLMLLKQRDEFEKEISHIMKKTGKYTFGGKGHGSLNERVNVNALHFYRSIPSTVPSRILL